MLLIIRRSLIAYIRALTNSPVQFGVFIMTLWFTSNGPAAYLIYPEMFADPMRPTTTIVFGFVPVTLNLCHATCHFITGIIGLTCVVRKPWATRYALFGGLYYLAWGGARLARRI